MAAGDIHIFDEFLEDLGLALHQLETGTFKVGLITSVQTPTENATDPRFGAGGTVNYATDQIAGTGGYTTGGTDIVATYSETAGTATFNGTDVTWTANGSSPTNARWAIVYNTQAALECVAYIDLGAVIDMTAGDLTLTWNASGLFTVTSTAGT